MNSFFLLQILEKMK